MPLATMKSKAILTTLSSGLPSWPSEDHVHLYSQGSSLPFFRVGLVPREFRMGQSVTTAQQSQSPSLNPSNTVSKKGCFNSWMSVSHHHILPFLLWPKTCTLSFLLKVTFEVTASFSLFYFKLLINTEPTTVSSSLDVLSPQSTVSMCPHFSAANEARLEAYKGLWYCGTHAKRCHLSIEMDWAMG